ncbi:MAG TPA: hypothetical protein ENK18_10450 [Deltaproteobacteria bacterium]|nr:hypothetical protein [Deltaproteobacteria bacterium]
MAPPVGSSASGRTGHQRSIRLSRGAGTVCLVVLEGYTPTGALQENTGTIHSGGGLAETR